MGKVKRVKLNTSSKKKDKNFLVSWGGLIRIHGTDFASRHRGEWQIAALSDVKLNSGWRKV
ncbi:MAG: hypothetical protein OEZ31_11925, partial [Nitrospirota bacterium]|nr:hypothetical protein [Nitrospirota bacterium]